MKKRLICIVMSICMLIACSVSVFASSLNAKPRAVTESNFISGYNDFIAYTTADFPGNNNCGAISSCNILSYYKMVRGCSGLFSGNMVGQDVYNSLYSLVGTTPTGTDWYKIRDGILTYVGIRGYTAVSYNYSDNWITKWSNLKGAINNNRPLIYVVNNNHAMMALGYKVENGEKYVYVAYGIGADVWGWVPFSISSYVFDINIY